jgi:hypothetical protein
MVTEVNEVCCTRGALVAPSIEISLSTCSNVEATFLECLRVRAGATVFLIKRMIEIPMTSD